MDDRVVAFFRSQTRDLNCDDSIGGGHTASVAAVSFVLGQNPTRAYHLPGAMPVQYVADRPDYVDEQPFLSENDAAMNKMMADMTIKPTGDVDRDFVAMMVPHHQGAIDMAKAVLRHGHNEQLRRLAREIVVTQQQEIAALRLAVGEQLPPATQPGATPASQSDAMPAMHSPDAMSPHTMHMQ
jgi:hypothetical protein